MRAPGADPRSHGAMNFVARPGTGWEVPVLYRTRYQARHARACDPRLCRQGPTSLARQRPVRRIPPRAWAARIRVAGDLSSGGGCRIMFSENGAERSKVKKALFAELDALMPATDSDRASSTSPDPVLRSSPRISRTRLRCLVAHTDHRPHLIHRWSKVVRRAWTDPRGDRRSARAMLVAAIGQRLQSRCGQGSRNGFHSQTGSDGWRS